MVIPIAILVLLLCNQIVPIFDDIRDVSVTITTQILDDSADTYFDMMADERAISHAAFLSQRDQDILLLANLMPSDEAFRIFSENRMASPAGEQELFPLYDEITFIDRDGQEIFKFVHPDSPKVNFPLNPELVNVSDIANTYIGAETYWETIQNLSSGEIYVGSAVGAYVGPNNAPEYFEGIVRWVTPVVDFEGEIWGFVTMALNYDHLIPFIHPHIQRFDYSTPIAAMEERLNNIIDSTIEENTTMLLNISAGALLLIIIVAVIVSSYVKRKAKPLLSAVFRYTSGERQYRINSKSTDEFGILSNALDDMVDSIEESYTSPLVITDTDLYVIYANNVSLEIIGKRLEDVVGKHYSEISIYPSGSPADPIAALRDGKEAAVFHNEYNNRYYKGVAHYLYSYDDNVSGYIITTSDVTDIQIAIEGADTASVAKSTFLSNMSHEIRTPLNAIVGMINIGISADSIEKKDYCLNKIDDASKHLLGIINDVLDVSKIGSNKYTLSGVKFSLREMLMRARDVMAYRVEQKRQNLVFNIDPHLPDVFIGDDQRFMQVITNLLSNSVKFTAEEGSITLNISANDKSSSYCTLLVEVIDNGIGISQAHQAQLFQSFEQAESGTSRRYGGTGLGLMICKSIIEMMGGKIWLESELGKGTKVSFLVRLAFDSDVKSSYNASDLTVMDSVALPGDGIVSSVDFSGFSILLVEDVDINREIVLAMLESTNLNIDCATNGEEAVDAFIRNPQKYDIIFMDLQMPVMDGFEATKRIRQSGVNRADSVPIVAMTANAFRKDVEMCIAAGMNGHIGKPLEFDLVIAALRKYLWR